ncbi:hypothetical protein, partial [Enterococcus faecium]
SIIGRILIFYIGAIFIIVSIYPWNQLSEIGSPFVQTFSKVGIKINKTESDTESKTLRVKNIYSLVGKVPQGCIFFISDYLK